MTAITPTADGRHARRERNVDLALETAQTLFVEETSVPSIEQVARRSGLSLRSLYRYFGDGEGLISAAIDRGIAAGRELARIDGPTDGPLDARIDRFVASRVRLHEELGANHRVTAYHAVHVPRLAAALDEGRRQLRQQLEQQFAIELDRLDRAERAQVVSAADVLCQLESLEHLRRVRRHTAAEAEAVLRRTLRLLLSIESGGSSDSRVATTGTRG